MSVNQTQQTRRRVEELSSNEIRIECYAEQDRKQREGGAEEREGGGGVGHEGGDRGGRGVARVDVG